MILVSLLRTPDDMTGLADRDWDVAIPQARRAGLLARLATVAQARKLYDAIPERPRQHLKAAYRLASKHQRDVRYELDRIRQMLGSLLGTIVLLKGAAYLAAGLAPSAGRVFADIDILVPEDKLAAVEAVLRLAGWRSGDVDPYDDLYYRRWMHQIPPLTHVERQSTIDVHHSIVPRTARIGAVPAEPLLRCAVPLPDLPGFAVLAPEDMVLHSATHLFNEGEFHNGLRDLSDLDLLFRAFGADPAFWPKIQARAVALCLTRPLSYALRSCDAVLGTPVPAEALEAAKRFVPAPVRIVMDICFKRALAPQHRSCQDALTRPALAFLYVRAHYLRMPLRLLVPHLLRKSFRREPAPETPDAV